MPALEVEFLTGVSVAAAPSRREQPEWPPHPDRLFQALVAAWGRDDHPAGDERDALLWLERTLGGADLEVRAPAAHDREVVTVFVPPNDARTTKDPVKSLRVIPAHRKNRQPRAFPAVLPQASPALVHYVWPASDGFARHREALARLAAEVSYLGHSHSLVRVALLERAPDRGERDLAWLHGETAALRVPHEGRLAHLLTRFERAAAESRDLRPNPSLATTAFAPPSSGRVARAETFDPETVTILADGGGFVPALEAFPLVARRLRDALLKCCPAGVPVPQLLSGHDPDGAPSSDPHVAIVPLAHVGWAHAGGRLMGLALVWPRAAPEDERRVALRALAGFLRSGPEAVTGLLHFGSKGSWWLGLEPDSHLESLSFRRYGGRDRAARRWGTVLPAVLDRHPKDKPGEDLAAIVARACLNVGLAGDAVDGLEVEVHKHSAVSGAPSVAPVVAALADDSPYRRRPIRHLVLTFPRPVAGPLLLGAGRFRGLGLCLPLGDGAGS